MAVASGIEYKMYAGSDIMSGHILDYLDNTRKVVKYSTVMYQENLPIVADESTPYGTKK